jgi:CRP/FNR family transcriptional regulator
MSDLPLFGQLSSIDTRVLKADCHTCKLNGICLPKTLSEADTQKLDQIVVRRRRVYQGEYLYRMNAPFKNLFAIRQGHFKTRDYSGGGKQQITGFQMAGELLGLDAIDTGYFQRDAVALHDSEVCEIPFDLLSGLFSQMPTLRRHFHRILSRQITLEQKAMLLLGPMRAEQRFAAYIITLSGRYAKRGLSPTHFELSMPREDIANYLGLTVETISRIIFKFRHLGWLTIEKRAVSLLDVDALTLAASGSNSQ